MAEPMMAAPGDKACVRKGRKHWTKKEKHREHQGQRFPFITSNVEVQTLLGENIRVSAYLILLKADE